MSIYGESSDKFIRTMLDAANKCTHPSEEEGGVIIDKNGEFEFIKLKNNHAGTSTAVGLYHADDKELNELVFPKIKDGWRFYSSFHTHPSFQATPSSLDLSTLFDGFKYNVIYSILTQKFSYSEWVGDESMICYIPKATLEKALKK